MAKRKGESELRIPPQNIEAEMSTLGSLMLDKDAIFGVADVLSPRDFYKPLHKEVYESMLDLFNAREPIDVLSVANRLRERGTFEEIGGSAYLASLVNTVPTASHVAHYASIVRKKRLLRDLIESSYHIAELGYNESEDVEMLIDEAEQRIFSIAKDSLRREFFPVREALEDAWNRIDKLHKGDGALRGVSTGFKDLDNLLAGLQPSDLIILAARPSLGKTSLALNIARNVAVLDKRAVGVFSLEMSREQLVDRLIASEANVDSWRLRTGRLRADGPDNEFVRVRDAMDVLSKAPMFIDDTSSPTCIELRAKARRLQAEHNLGLVVIDYLQLIRSHRFHESRVQEVSEISRSLKAMAKELNIPVLALSQLSRGVEMRPSSVPKLSDLRESGCLTGDTVITRADTGEMIPIKNLVGKTNVPVFSINNSWRLQIQNISKVFSSGVKKIFELKTKSGRLVKASANHSFLTVAGWKRLDELIKGDHIAIPRALPINIMKSALSDDELILLAHLIGDGCVLPRQPIHYTSADSVNIEIVSRTAKRLFNIRPRLIKQKNWFHVYLPSPYRLTHGKYHPITKWFYDLNIERVRSYEKKLPEKLFASSTEGIRLFLHHLWATDGNISWKLLQGRKASGAIYYSTTSRILAEQVQHLLLRLGILSTVRMVKQKKKEKIYRENYHVYLQSSEEQIKFCNLVGSYGSRGQIIPQLLVALEDIQKNPNNDSIPREAWKLLIEPAKVTAGMSWRELSEGIDTAYCGSTLFKTGLSRERMTRVAHALSNNALLAFAYSDIYWDEVVSVMSLGTEEVFDATVPETHNFLANDILVHNSIEQDADVVMFIYREDKVKENSDKKNIAEILVEKHRNGPTGKVPLYFHEETASFRPIEKHMEEPQEWSI